MNETERPGPDERAPDDPGPKDMSVSGLAKEALGEIAGLEHRLPQTIRVLLTQPGFLTDEYRRGRGRDYVSPIRLYVVASALYFASSWADAPDGVNLGLVTVTLVLDQVPTSSVPHLILIAAVPLFALLLSGLFGGRTASGPAADVVNPPFRWRDADAPPIGEFLVFALYFQTVLLVLVAVLRLTPLPNGLRPFLSIGFFMVYVGLAASRLWGGSLPVAFLKAVVAMVLYVLSLALATGAAMWIEGSLLG